MTTSHPATKNLLRWRGVTGAYLCAHPWLDIISQGRTPQEAFDSFMDSLALYVLNVVDKDGKAAFPVAPTAVSEGWAKCAMESKSTDSQEKE